jgi:hypothetical protein
LQDALGGDFEVLNGGVPGYGTDQALLRARRLRETLRPDVVVLGIYLQDLLRNLTLFRVVKHPFTQFPWSKPRFILDGEGVKLINHPVEAWPPPEVERVLLDYKRSPLSRHDRMWWPGLYEESGWYGSRLWRYWESRRIHRERYDATQRFTREGGEGVLVTARIARLFREETQAEGIRAYVVLLPGVEGLPGYREGGRPPLRYLHGELERVSVPFADAGTALWQSLDHGSGEKPEVLYVNGVGHPNRRANGVIARVVATLVRP